MHRFPDRQWQSQITEEIDVEGDALLLEILVNNLLENAIKYSPRDGIIALPTCNEPKIKSSFP